MANREILVETRDLSKVYQVGDSPLVALNRVNLQVPRGSFLAVVGTSGSGKSTLLNMLAGLEKPTAGEIWIGDQGLHTFNENQLVTFRRENIGFIFQSFNLIPSMTALQNVAWPLAFRGMDKQERLLRAERALIRMGLGHHMHHLPTQMSGGQQQRVGIARALVVEPKLLFADEPTGNLDSRTAADILNLFREIIAREGQTMIMVTHDDHLASFADTIIRIVDGRIVGVQHMQHPSRQEVH